MSRRSLPTTTGLVRPGSSISSIREILCQGDRQPGLDHDARATGILPCHMRVCEGSLGPFETLQPAYLAHQLSSLKRFSRLRLPRTWRSLQSTLPH
eukprot:1448263-Amphidinium_carterae.1